MKITKNQLRRIIKEAVSLKTLQDLEGRPHTDSRFRRGSEEPPAARSAAGSFSDTIVMSATGDSVIVDGEEFYVQDVSYFLEIRTGIDMNENDQDNLIFALEEQMADGFVELEVSYENGRWNW